LDNMEGPKKPKQNKRNPLLIGKIEK